MNNRLYLLESRKSVMSFTDETLSKEIINKLKAVLTMINTHEAGLKFQLFINDSVPFKGIAKSYGFFVNAFNFVAAVVDTGMPHIYERAGYFAEQFAIKAVELGLGTCFVRSAYDKKTVNAQLRAGEKILFLILIGYPQEKLRVKEKIYIRLANLKKMAPKEFFAPKCEYEEACREFPFLETGLKGVAFAPSLVNKRTMRISMEERDGRKILYAKVKEEKPDTLIDLGIAKYNFNFATHTECEWGNGSSLTEDMELINDL